MDSPALSSPAVTAQQPCVQEEEKEKEEEKEEEEEEEEEEVVVEGAEKEMI